MNIVALVRSMIPQPVKNFSRQGTLPWRVSNLLSPYLPSSICVDVGASYYPHVKWLLLLNAPNTQWLAVEPNKDNLGYIKTWCWHSQVSTCTTGLSRNGGTQTLYVTNVDSGSSLLPPEIAVSMQRRVTNLDYFFPVTPRAIETLTLVQAIEGLVANAPIFVKLDTQGTELSILQGAQTLFDGQRIVGIEMESTLLAQPLMKGSGKFWQACEYLESQGFELLHIKPIAAMSRSGKVKKGRNTYLNECDAVFALRQDIAMELPIDYRISLVAFYLTNYFYEEALIFLEFDREMSTHLKNKGCQLDKLASEIKI